MSYQVLARKWRPRVFSEMVGQEHVLQALINALDRDRLHHAYLFTGTRGVGKTTIARILAKCLNCEAGVSSVPCGECSACTNIAAGRFVDLIEVDAASRTKVEDTRELLDNVQYAPTQGRYKVYLIDEVHMLSSHSFNALLKTLEEPPPHVKFLLATTDPQKLPVTILSRCLQFNLKNLGPERIVNHLQHVLTEERVPFEEAALWSLARAADGSMRDALSLADQAIGHGGGKISSADVSDMLGSIDRTVVIRICQALADRDGPQALKLVESLAEQAPDYNQALAEMLSVWHRVAIAQTAPDALDNSHSDHGEVLDLADKLPAEDVQLFYQITLLGRRDLPMAAEPRSGFEMTLLRQLAFQPVTGQGINPPTARAGTVSAPGVPVSAKKPEPASVPRAEAAGPTANQAAPPGSERNSRPVPEAGGDPVSATTTAVKAPARVVPLSVTVPDRRPEETLTASPTKGPRPAPVDSRIAPGKSPSSASTRAKTSPEQAAAARPVSQQPEVNDDLAAAPEAPREQSPATPVTLNCLQPEQWIDVYRQLAIGGVLQNTAANLVLTERQGKQLGFVLDKQYSSLFDHSHEARLASALSDYFGEAVEVDIVVGTVSTETPRACSLRLRAERRAQAIQSLYDDANVQQIIRLFDGKLLEQTVEPKD